MRRTFIKKEGVVITTLARYLLGEKCGNRLKTIDELANECRSSVGLTQAALKTLESSGAIRIERRGRNGSYLVEMDNKALLTHVDINNVVCVKRRTKNAKAFHDKCENFSFRASNETAVLITAFYSLHGDHLGYG